MTKPILKAILLFASVTISVPKMVAQTIALQSFSLSSGSYEATQLDATSIEWRLDLGATAIKINPTYNFIITAGFIQPTMHRYALDKPQKMENLSIQIRYSNHQIFLCSDETDLIIHGYQIFDLQGHLIFSDPSKYASSFLNKQLELNAFAPGVYVLLIYYAPEIKNNMNATNYWTKSLKIFKQ